MQLSRRLWAHGAPKIQPPRDAGVVFSSTANPIRYTINFKPWLALCLLGFTGAICGNKFYSHFLLRPNPPNPVRDPADLPPERHPHTPEEDDD